ncbi:sensor histidine kinase [Lysobacter sp. N42]|uniref:sensor histidine kinase n=1 Tax=Lysobacter sp. N42 TaxID=2545719 RepID=UPI001047151D|nr:histidine kinase [Lysobacter sp. N42]TCZ88654.1 sensor histidine kinase [Lysobacter sp. N42]
MRTRPPGSRARSGPAHPLDALWQPRVVLWVMLAGEGLASVLSLSYAGDKDRWTYFGIASLTVQWVSLLTLGLLYVSRRRLASLPPQTIAWLALGTFVLSALAISALGWAALGDALTPEREDWRPVAARLTGIALIVGLFGLAAFQNHWNATRAAVRAKQAELEALQARIRPHFLFNTLNTGASLVHQRPEEAERLLLDLADLFRAALAGPREIPLEEELSLARRYLEIEALRFGERLRVEWKLPAEIPDAMVPALSIQPLVENAIRHGVERVPQGGRVEISLTTTPEHIVVRVTNPLVLSDSERPVSHRVGLNASQARIEAFTGGRGSVQTGRQGELYVATVRLPRRPVAPPARGKWR